MIEVSSVQIGPNLGRLTYQYHDTLHGFCIHMLDLPMLSVLAYMPIYVTDGAIVSKSFKIQQRKDGIVTASKRTGWEAKIADAVSFGKHHPEVPGNVLMIAITYHPNKTTQD
jgi:hypothetical protein